MPSLFRSSDAPLLLVVVAVVLTPTVFAWTTTLADKASGICAWRTFAPSCSIPLSCNALFVPLTQYSPVNFSQVVTELQTGPTMCLSRQFPLVHNLDPLTQVPSEELPTRRMNASLILAKDGGGVVVARCSKVSPIFLRVNRCGDVSAGDGPTTLFPQDAIMEVMEVQFYNGLLHYWPKGSSHPVTGDLEVEVFLRRARRSTISSEDGEDVYMSGCLDYQQQRLPPEMIIAFAITTSVGNSVNASIFTRLLDAIVNDAAMLAASNAFIVNIDPRLRFLPSPVGVPFHTWAYVGSMSHPPCTKKIPRIIADTPIPVPQAVLSAIATASNHVVNAYDGMTHRLLRSTVFYNMRAYQTENGTLLADVTPEPPTAPAAKVFSRVLYALLVVVNIILVFYLVVLVFVRWGWLQLPTAAGGFNHPMQFYSSL